MYKIKLFVPNKNGKIELTVEELEDLLNKAYEDGLSARLRSDYVDKSTLNQWYYNGIGQQIPCHNFPKDELGYKITVGDPPYGSDFTCSELTSTSGLKDSNSITIARNE